MSVKDFHIYSMHTSERLKDSRWNKLNAWLVHIVLNPLGYIKDPLYFGGRHFQD